MAAQKILICDDSPADLANIRHILQTTNCVLIEATDGKEAFAKAKAEKPDVIFLDIVMPRMDGFATCRALHEDPETKHIPVIFVSSKNQKADKIWAQMQGAKDLIGKPGDKTEILAALKALGL
jgi:twitching motility two-component system response regulator PilH